MSFKSFVQLLGMVRGMQSDLGLADCMPLERDVVAVIGALLEQGHPHVRTEAIASHPLLAGVPRSSLHRALRSLLDRGVISHAEGRKTGLYVFAGR